MKQIILISSLVALVYFTSGQTPPQAINYQSILRDSLGHPIPNESIALRFTIEDGINSDTIVYQEVDDVITNELGLFTIAIGEGQVLFSSFADIDWSAGNKYLIVELDKGRTGTFVNMGISQLLSVPYALYTEVAGKTSEVLVVNNDSLSLSGASPVAMAGNIKGYSNNPEIGFSWGGTFATIDSVTFNLAIPHTVLCQADVANWGHGTECTGVIELSFDGTVQEASLAEAQNRAITTGGNNSTLLTTSWMIALPAGQHVARLLGNYTSNCGLFKNPHVHVLVLGN